MTEMGYERARDDRGWFGDLDWGALLASVVAGFGITLLLIAFGAAAGIEASDDEGADNGGRISAAVGTWTVVSALLGTLIGTFIGGRFSRWQSPGSAVYHGITSWGLATLLGSILGALGGLGVLGAALRVREEVGGTGGAAGAATEDAADKISWGGWALCLGLLLTLATAILGWWLGARTRVTDAERDMRSSGRRSTTRRTTASYGREEETPATTARGVTASEGTTGTTGARTRRVDFDDDFGDDDVTIRRSGAEEEDRPPTWTGT